VKHNLLVEETDITFTAIRKRGACRRPVSVRPSVRLSVCLSLLYCIGTAEDIIKHFSRSGTPSF